MKKLGVVVLSLALLGMASVEPAPSQDPAVDPVGGARYFLCAAFQTVKYGGMILGRPDAVIVGAIGSGIACGFGW